MLSTKPNLVEWRRKYVTAVLQARSNNRPIFYLDESYCHQYHVKKKTWKDATIASAGAANLRGLTTGIKTPASMRGKRIILLHCGNEDGFLADIGRTYIAGQRNPEYDDFDYHGDVDSTLFENWLGQILKKLPQNAILAMDNASYHRRKGSNIPTSKSKKADYMDFLEERGVEFDPDWTVGMLWDLVKNELEGDAPCMVDEIAAQAGVKILRLPPYHPELNPIELVWAYIKARVAKRNVSFKVAEVKVMVKEAIAEMPVHVWRRCVKHVMKQELLYAKHDNVDLPLEEPRGIGSMLSKNKRVKMTSLWNWKKTDQDSDVPDLGETFFVIVWLLLIASISTRTHCIMFSRAIAMFRKYTRV